MKKIIFTLLIVALLIVLVIALAIYKPWVGKPVADNRSLRQPPAGSMIGFADQHSTYAWLGIPFAQPPLGALRWRAPQAPAQWSGTRAVLEHSEPCAQLRLFTLGDEHATTGSEDCLYLNIWTPQLTAEQIQQQTPARRLPVMVWIHGGGNTLGFSSSTLGHHLAGEQQVVVVTLQYRLGIFGWLSHPALRAAATSPADASSNFGLLDLIAGLQWVHDNIAAFGGDPANVTIFGESAGGHNVYALLAAPPAKGLFHRAIVESGSLGSIPTSAAENYSDDAEPGLAHSSREYINRLLIDDKIASDRAAAKAHQQQMSAADISAYLRGKTTQQLLAVVERRSLGMYFAPTIIRDGYAVPQQSFRELFADTARYNSVPIITGTNRDEYKLFLSSSPDLTEKRFGFVPKIKNLETYNRITGYFSDTWKAQAVDDAAEILQHSQGATVFTYRLDWDDEADYGIVNLHDLLGAAHSIDINFVFGDDATQGLPLATRSNAQGRQQLTAALMAYWANFARTGTPGNGGQATLPEWTAWSAGEPSLMVFDIAAKGGVRMSADRLSIATVKQRLHDDRKVDNEYARCQLYVQLFYLGLTADFWDGNEYNEWGCSAYQREQFKTVL
ncbi:MAG TPA: carboxylesterase family protein [Spongiibacteraceae bacterium]|nr:carboxylesterase family protein [Spongiibacteraceae bacterium]